MIDKIILFLALFITGFIIFGELKEQAHPHRHRADWTPEELRAHLKEYHPDAYRALLEVEKESLKTSDKRPKEES